MVPLEWGTSFFRNVPQNDTWYLGWHSSVSVNLLIILNRAWTRCRNRAWNVFCIIPWLVYPFRFHDRYLQILLCLSRYLCFADIGQPEIKWSTVFAKKWIRFSDFIENGRPSANSVDRQITSWQIIIIIINPLIRFHTSQAKL